MCVLFVLLIQIVVLFIYILIIFYPKVKPVLLAEPNNVKCQNQQLHFFLTEQERNTKPFQKTNCRKEFMHEYYNINRNCQILTF